MAAKNRPGPNVEVDLEATDELPAPDLAEAGESQVNTDIFPGPVIPAGMAELTDSLRDVEHRLQRKIERVQKLEAELQLADSQRQQLDARLHEQEQAAAARESALRAEFAGQQAAMQAELATARDELQQQRLALSAAQARLSEQSSERTHQDHDLAEWRRRAERAHEALTTWQAARAVSESLLDASQARQSELEESLRIATERAGMLGAQVAARDASIADLQQQLRQMGERLGRLESEAHASAALLGDLQQNMERLGREDTGTLPVLREAPPENIVRMLILQEGGADVVYPIGRHTSIGRTPENDIQIDTTYISRHHAVLLSGPDACIVEDLNSTNGVLVNGRRVGRQVLHDGDTLTVGKTEFRYQQRS